MENETICIPKKEYEYLIGLKKVDRELFGDIAKGIKDILQGRVKEI